MPNRRLHTFIDAAVFLAALTLYWITLSPGLLPADAGEFQLVAAKLGVAHPPGYPLYTLFAWVFTRLTPANPFYGVNLFSAFTMALAVMLVGRTARRFSGSAWGGLAAALSFAAAASVWSTATQASIRPLTAFFTALAVEQLAAFAPSPPGSLSHGGERGRELAGFAFAFGLGVAHHPSLAFLGPFFALYIVLVDPSILRQPKRWIAPVLAFAAGFLPWLYLPIRGAMGAPLAPEGIDTWRGFWDHVLARGFAGDFFTFRTPTELADRARVWLNILRLQWNWPILIGMAIAPLVLAWRDRRLLLMLGGGFAAHSFITMTYRAPQTVEYLIPAYVLMGVGLGTGLGILNHRGTEKYLKNLRVLRASVVNLLPLAVCAAAIVHLAAQYPSFAWLARDDSTRTRAESLLLDAPDHAVILASWHWAMPLQALQTVEGARPDVEVIYVYPEGAEPLAETWVRRIEASIEEGPVIVTSFYLAEFAAAPYFYEPIDGGWRVLVEPRTELPDGFERIEIPFSSGVTLIGIEPPREGAAGVGGVFDVRLAWRIDAAQPTDLTAFVHFVNAAGTVISSSDRPLLTSRAGVGDILIDRYTVGMPPSGVPSPQDTYSLLAGMYRAEPDGTLTSFSVDDGSARAPVSDVEVLPAQWPIPAGGVSAIPLGGDMYISHVEVTPADRLQPGDEVIVDVTFVSARPILADYVVKIDLIGDGYAWRAQSDHIPATGALPTLKWLWGWQVTDRHRFTVPEDASTTSAHAELVVYDHFTGEVLPILDPELAQQGIAVPIYQWPAD